MFVASRRGSRFGRNSLSNHFSNMDQDRDLHTRMEWLKNNMKLILDALNITRVENTRTRKQNIKTHAASSLLENPKKYNYPLKFRNESMEKDLKKDEEFE